ncbi:unnamed protein product [Rotaria socialis]
MFSQIIRGWLVEDTRWGDDKGLWTLPLYHSISINNRRLLYPCIKSIMIMPMRCWFVFLVATFVMKIHGLSENEDILKTACGNIFQSSMQ